MDLRPCSLLLLWTLVVALALLAQEVLAQRIYTNTWAVLVPAGPQEADRLARKHGFLNLGLVSPQLHFPHGSGWLCHDLGGFCAQFEASLGQHCHCICAQPLQQLLCRVKGSQQLDGARVSHCHWGSLVAQHDRACSACWSRKEEKPIPA